MTNINIIYGLVTLVAWIGFSWNMSANASASDETNNDEPPKHPYRVLVGGAISAVAFCLLPGGLIAGIPVLHVVVPILLGYIIGMLVANYRRNH